MHVIFFCPSKPVFTTLEMILFPLKMLGIERMLVTRDVAFAV